MVTKIIETYARVLLTLMKIMMGLLLFSVFFQVLGRYTPIPRFMWTLELVNFGLIWMVFLGSIIGVRESRHFFIDLFPDEISLQLEIVLKGVYYIVLYTVTYIFVRYGWTYLVDWGMSQTSDLTGINLGFLYFSVPLTGVSWFVFLTESLYNDLSGKEKIRYSHGNKNEE